MPGQESHFVLWLRHKHKSTLFGVLHRILMYNDNQSHTKCVQFRGIENFSKQSDIVFWKTNDIRTGIFPTFEFGFRSVDLHQMKNVTLKYSHPLSIENDRK